MAILLVYYRDRNNHICLPPSSAMQLPRDYRCPRCGGVYERYEATTLVQVDMVRDRLWQLDREDAERELQRDEAAFAARRKAVYDSLYTRMVSSSTSAYEREFLKYYLQIHREEKRREYQRRFACDNAYFEAREFDKPRNAEEVLKESL